MELTIKSRKLGRDLIFYVNRNGGYVYVNLNNRPGTLGDQICYGGKLSGSTVQTAPAGFCGVCKKWYRAYLRNEEKYSAVN